MKTKIFLALLLLTWIPASILSGCASPSASSKPEVQKAPTYQTIQPEDALDLLEDNPDAILLDVRTLEEYEEIRIPNSILLPLEQIASEAPALLPDKEAPIVLYCRTGNRSKAASIALLEMGYQKVYDMGGMSNWPYVMVSGK